MERPVLLKSEDVKPGDIVRFRVGQTDMQVCSKTIECVFTERSDNGTIELYPITSLDKVDRPTA
jgi:hypothetical protein